MLYTRQGDGGTTKTLHCSQQLSKSSAIAEALGAVDELNSLLGFAKTQCQGLLTGKGESLPQTKGSPPREDYPLILSGIQQNLFIIQAELAGAVGKTITADKVAALEKIIDGIEKKLPPIKTFFVAGTGPSPITRGGTPAEADATTRANGFNPSDFALSALINNNAAAPSFKPVSRGLSEQQCNWLTL